MGGYYGKLKNFFTQENSVKSFKSSKKQLAYNK